MRATLEQELARQRERCEQLRAAGQTEAATAGCTAADPTERPQRLRTPRIASSSDGYDAARRGNERDRPGPNDFPVRVRSGQVSPSRLADRLHGPLRLCQRVRTPANILRKI